MRAIDPLYNAAEDLLTLASQLRTGEANAKGLVAWKGPSRAFAPHTVMQFGCPRVRRGDLEGLGLSSRNLGFDSAQAAVAHLLGWSVPHSSLAFAVFQARSGKTFDFVPRVDGCIQGMTGAERRFSTAPEVEAPLLSLLDSPELCKELTEALRLQIAAVTNPGKFSVRQLLGGGTHSR